MPWPVHVFFGVFIILSSPFFLYLYPEYLTGQDCRSRKARFAKLYANTASVAQRRECGDIGLLNLA
jgi:hypothetical protein